MPPLKPTLTNADLRTLGTDEWPERREKNHYVFPVREGRGIAYVCSRKTLECERQFREEFEAAPEEEQGDIVRRFLIDVPPTAWPTAPWVFEAIARWRGSSDNHVRDANLRKAQAALRIDKYGKLIEQMLWGHLPTPREQHIEKALPAAVEFQRWAAPLCAAARKQARWYQRRVENGQDRFLMHVLRGDAQTLIGAPESPTSLYERVREEVAAGTLDQTDITQYLEVLPNAKGTAARPARLAAGLASLIFGVPRYRIEKASADRASRREE